MAIVPALRHNHARLIDAMRCRHSTIEPVLLTSMGEYCHLGLRLTTISLLGFTHRLHCDLSIHELSVDVHWISQSHADCYIMIF